MKETLLRRKRLSMGLTATKVAEIVGIPYMSYLTAEKGTACPSVVHAIKIARFIKLPVEILFADFMEGK